MAEYKKSRRSVPRKPGSSEMVTSLADILPGLCQDLSIEKKINEMALLALWPKQVAGIAGESAAIQTKALRLKKQGNKRILLVRVAHAALASELGFHVPTLKAALNRFTPQTGLTVDQIQLVVGTL